MHDLDATTFMIDDVSGVRNTWQIIGVGARDRHCDP
jgi:hypothetical protein